MASTLMRMSDSAVASLEDLPSALANGPSPTPSSALKKKPLSAMLKGAASDAAGATAKPASPTAAHNADRPRRTRKTPAESPFAASAAHDAHPKAAAKPAVELIPVKALSELLKEAHGSHVEVLVKRYRAVKRRIDRIEKYEHSPLDQLQPDQRDSLAQLNGLRAALAELAELIRVFADLEDEQAAKRAAEDKAAAKLAAADRAAAKTEGRNEVLAVFRTYVALARELVELDPEDPIVAQLRAVFLPELRPTAAAAERDAEDSESTPTPNANEDPIAKTFAAARRVHDKDDAEVEDVEGVTYAQIHERLIEAPLRIEDLLPSAVEFMVDESVDAAASDLAEDDDTSRSLAGDSERSLGNNANVLIPSFLAPMDEDMDAADADSASAAASATPTNDEPTPRLSFMSAMAEDDLAAAQSATEAKYAAFADAVASLPIEDAPATATADETEVVAAPAADTSSENPSDAPKPRTRAPRRRGPKAPRADGDANGSPRNQSNGKPAAAEPSSADGAAPAGDRPRRRRRGGRSNNKDKEGGADGVAAAPRPPKAAAAPAPAAH
ncbi:hypothetical protein H9P43_002161 [Blastocladiella emersonii ATCC 22665]|nr:hypothetical protein H9P43_002161 [Blastocladiella emersonii ATCC 22665]